MASSFQLSFLPSPYPRASFLVSVRACSPLHPMSSRPCPMCRNASCTTTTTVPSIRSPRTPRLATARFMIYVFTKHDLYSSPTRRLSSHPILIPILTSALSIHTLHTRPLSRSPRASPACSFLSPVCLLWHLWYTSTTHLRSQHVARSNQCVLRLSVRPSHSRSLS